MNLSSLVTTLAFTGALSLCAASAAAQTAPLHGYDVSADLDTGWVSNPTASEQVTGWFVAEVPAAPWVRLAFGEVDLDGDPLAAQHTKLRVTSLLDLGVQILDARSLAQWQGTSAYFNGGAVLVEIVAPPFAGPSRATVTRITAGIAPVIEESICGASDDRLPSTDPRAARVVPVGCTVWLIDDCNHCFLTAGHCAGTGLQVVQFNVPLSTAGGSLQNPPPSDQYAVDVSSKLTNGGLGIGNDWGYFGVFPNSTTGLTPYQVTGQAYTLALPPPFNPADTIRITGYGTDSTPPEWNQVQQTHTGPWMSASGTALNYEVDTTGGNSGSPILHEATGTAIGIHTHAGCSTTPGSGNNGTSTTLPALQAALAAPAGVCAAGIAPAGTLPSLVAAGAPTLVRLHATSALVPGSVELRVRPNGSAPFTPIAMSDLGGGLYEAFLPPFECGDAPQFFFAATTTSCGTITSPAGAPTTSYGVSVGELQPLFADDFQTDQGWVATAGPGLTSGNWERGVPVTGAGGAPTSDFDGSGICFVTQNVSGNFDVDNGTAFLTSPAFDLTGGARVGYRYWFGSSGSTGGEDSFRVEVSTDPAGAVWTTLRTYTTVANAWRADAIAIGAEIAATSTVRVRFSATDASPGHIVEGGLDAFVIDRLTCGASGIAFCSGDGSATACPCGNTGGAGRGCGNSSNALGARLRAFGTASVANDLVTLAGDGLPAATTGLFFQGDGVVGGGNGAVFGDGLRCAGGFVIRLGTRATANGSVAFGEGVATDPGVAATGLVPPSGATRNYQLWYRNVTAFCTSSTFNTTNGLTIVWTP